MKVVSFESWKSHRNATGLLYNVWDPLYVHAVKGHISRSKDQVVRWAQTVKFTSFENLEVQLEINLD